MRLPRRALVDPGKKPPARRRQGDRALPAHLEESRRVQAAAMSCTPGGGAVPGPTRWAGARSTVTARETSWSRCWTASTAHDRRTYGGKPEFEQHAEPRSVADLLGPVHQRPHRPPPCMPARHDCRDVLAPSPGDRGGRSATRRTPSPRCAQQAGDRHDAASRPPAPVRDRWRQLRRRLRKPDDLRGM